MFVIFGASTDIGQRLGEMLKTTNQTVRPISRSLPDHVQADLTTGEGLDAALRGAEVVISCAHGRYTDNLLAALPPTVKRLVLMGSAWRYSRIPNPRADEVRAAEKLFLRSGLNGVMLHSTMIYGGRQENNIQRLIRLLQKLPVIPVPGGGKHQVQPIYVDDVVRCLFSAAHHEWQGPNVVPVAGPGLSWREMAQHCAAAINRRCSVLSVPTAPAILALDCLRRLGVSPVHPDVIRRFSEGVDIPLDAMSQQLGLVPRDFASGVALAVAEWRRTGII